MDENIKTQLTLFAEDSLVNHSPLQASNLARKMTVTSGLKCYESSKSQLRLGSLVKTFLGSSAWHSTMFALTWKPKVTKSNRLLFRLVPSKPTTKETDAGLWPTPTRMTGGEEVAPSHKNGTHGWNIGAAVKDSLSKDPLRVWPTPMNSDWKNMDTANQRTLAKEVRVWPTPTLHGNYNRKGLSKKSGDGLETAVKMWPTPRASEYKDCGPVGSKSHTHMDQRSYLCAKAKDSDRPTGKLSPMWTEWLMGFPIGWTELDPSETP
jgi:hypothetical protein